MNKSVNIFILNWNGKKVVHECLDSLMKISYLNSNVIVIDNGSKDDSINFMFLEKNYLNHSLKYYSTIYSNC